MCGCFFKWDDHVSSWEFQCILLMHRGDVGNFLEIHAKYPSVLIAMDFNR